MEMGRIVVSQNMSLDGVVQDPTGEEGFRHGGWFLEYGSEDYEAWAEVGLDEARGAEALLMGRRSDAYFGPRWLSRSGEWADRLNGLPKYVVSSTLEAPRWSNATVLSGEVVNEVAKLKETVAGEIVVVASRQLVHALMEHDLVDELRLMVYPVVLGDGDRLFGETSHKVPVRLVDARTVGAGLAYLTYQVVRDA
jgi:dihydrofolate reductase